jgi:hypothetical protein
VSDNPEWFAPKRYGIGSGLPISWQGWAVLGAFLALLGLSSLLIRYSWVGYFCIVIMLTVTLTVICARTTRGGWRWRWGEKD